MKIVKNKNRKIKLYIIMILAILLLSVLGTTYALFVAGVDDSINTDVIVQLSDNASITFVQEDNLVINAGMSNFSENGSNLSSSSTSKVTLSSNDNYTTEYYLYFNIEENNFVYTTDEGVAELVLQIKDPNGEMIEEINGLDYVTSEGISGFDVTTKEGLYSINTSNIISTETTDKNQISVTDEWTFTIYFVYLKTNQNANSSRTFKSNIIIDSKEYIKTSALSEIILINNASDELDDEKNIAEAINYFDNKDIPDFGTIADTDEGIFATEDDFGTSYYFRGAVEDNYVEFADMLWRIVRIDGEGNIKLMLYNENLNANSYLAINNGTKVAFNSGTDNVGYLGYMYELDEQHGNTLSSNAKNILETWYEENLLINYDEYISKTAIHCVDRSVYTRTGSANSYTYTNIEFNDALQMFFGAYARIYEGNLLGQQPSLVCVSEADKFSVDKTTIGNGELTYPIAMISADESSLAGGVRNIENDKYYLNTNYVYWTISPALYNISNAYVYYIGATGYYNSGNLLSTYTLFPAISLTFNVLYEYGNGTLESPYKIKYSV